MKKKLLIIAVCGILLASCQAAREVPYFQDITYSGASFRAQEDAIKLQPDDKLAIVVNCQEPELTNLFNLIYVNKTIGTTNSATTNSQGGIACYTIDKNGDIDFPVVGKIHIAGMTRNEVINSIKFTLESRHLVKDPVVTVEFANLMVSVMGEVARPGRYAIEKDNITLLDALTLAGDLTIYGKRENVKVIRKENGKDVVYFVNLDSAEQLSQSPVFFVKQDDIIYIEPNKMRARQATVNANTMLSASFWISVASLVASVMTTVIVILQTKN